MKSKLLENRINSLKDQISKNQLLEAESLIPGGAISSGLWSSAEDPLKKLMLGDMVKPTAVVDAKGMVQVALEATKKFLSQGLDKIKAAVPIVGKTIEDVIELATKEAKEAKDTGVLATISKFGKFISNALSSLAETLKSFAPGGGIKLIMIGLMILAIVVFIMGLSGADKPVASIGRQLMDSLKNVFNDITNGLGEILSSVGDLTKLLSSVGNMILKVLSAPFRILSDVFKSLSDNAEQLPLIILGLAVMGFGIALEIKIFSSKPQ